MSLNSIKPFELLLEYEKRSLFHSNQAVENETETGDWSGIGFKLGNDQFVASVELVNEVVIFPEAVKIPGIQPWVLGLVNIRSNLIPAIDLKLFISGEATRLSKHSRMLVVNQPGGQVGLVVDEVFGQRHFTSANIQSLQEEDANAGLLRYCADYFAVEEINWHVFDVERLVVDSNFQNASVR